MSYILNKMINYCLNYSTFEEHHSIIISVLWELVVNSNADVKISAATIMKILVGALFLRLFLFFLFHSILRINNMKFDKNRSRM